MKTLSILIFASLALISALANDEDRVNNCVEPPIDPTRLPVGLPIRPGDALCDENYQFGVFAYKGEVRDGKEYTEYKVELRRDGKLLHMLRSISMPSTDLAPVLILQHDGNLMFGSSNKQPISGCVNLPGQDNPNHILELMATFDGELIIVDVNNGEFLWTYYPDGSQRCYPHSKPICRNALHKGQRMTWDEFICTHDTNGQVEYHFGMDRTGSLGLYHYGQLVYRPKSPEGWVRAHYLHFQNDGHLTAYDKLSSHVRASIKWATRCVKSSAEKLVLTSDGDVLQLDKNGRAIWSLLGSQAPSGEVVDARDTVPNFCFA